MWGEEEKKISALDKNVNRLLVAGSVTQKKTHTHIFTLRKRQEKLLRRKGTNDTHTYTRNIS